MPIAPRPSRPRAWRAAAIAALAVVLSSCGPARNAARDVATTAAATAPPPAIESALQALAEPANQQRLTQALATPATADIARTAAAGAVAGVLQGLGRDGGLAGAISGGVGQAELTAATRALAAAMVLGVDDGLAAARRRPTDESGLAPLMVGTREAAQRGLTLGVGALVGLALLIAVLAALLVVQIVRARRRTTASRDGEAAIRIVRRLARDADAGQRTRLAEAARAEGASDLV
ncbi:MAG TPA: hypothetical protein VEL07_18005 [Planctomycetota bacterium]|nr:hypothetical protein [Planctomycetota bacterium]